MIPFVFFIPTVFFTVSVFFEVGRGLHLFFYVWWIVTKTLVAHRGISEELMYLFYLFLIAIHFSDHRKGPCFIKPGII